MSKNELVFVTSLGLVGGTAAGIVYPLADSVGNKIANYNPEDSELKENAKIFVGSLANISIVLAASGGAAAAMYALAVKLSK